MTKSSVNSRAEAPLTPSAIEEFRNEVADHIYHSLGTALQVASKHDLTTALSLAVRDRLIERARKTADAQYAANPKYVYYLSAEYLLGKQLPQALLYTGTTELARATLAGVGVDLQELLDLDPEPGLGNGGLGRLAACFIDSLATLDLPAVGYGIRYEFGIFQQSFVDGYQVERPDHWLRYGNPWEFIHPDDMVEVGFGGHTEMSVDASGRPRVHWLPRERVLGEPCTTLVPGYRTATVNILRLWRARATDQFDFQLFDAGDYTRAVAQKVASENISKVLYPNDNTPQGQELRLRQQYFFVACSIRDIIRRFRLRNDEWEDFPNKVAIQLNDTHPVIGIPELMRILLDEVGMEWEQAWGITTRSFAYTCHTLLPEALEQWPVSLFERLLPRHLELIYEINQRFLDEIRTHFPGDEGRVVRMSLISEGAERRVRMAHLATVGSFAVNGVAALHSRLLREQTLADFAVLWPERFQNKTNGVTPRRFIKLANPLLSDLITEAIGDGWLNQLEQLRGLEAYIDDSGFRQRWGSIKAHNRQELAGFLERSAGTTVRPDAMMDVIVKRLHEYKRQLLKVMHIIALYQRLQDNPTGEIIPRTFLFGAKAAPGYAMAKLIIKLINNVGQVVNNDPLVNGRLKVAFPANFNVTIGQIIYPAADLSEQISLAGKEASGTGNMKFALNGALTIGTLDGANVEIRNLVGADNFFLFGLQAEEVAALKADGYNPRYYYETNPILRHVVDSIADGTFSGGDRALFQPIVDSLLTRDEYLHLADFQSYLECQDEVDQLYRDQEQWTRMSILNSARCGFFSSDRTIGEYAEAIWRVKPVTVS